MKVETLAVFCGASRGVREVYAEAASHLGTLAARRGLRLCYGGGSVGLMGALADGALGAGGEVMGVIPTFLNTVELAHEGIARMEIVDGMMPRKALIAQEADAFAALPGGYGTLDELLEMVTWAQLGLHGKPILLLDTEGFWQPWMKLLDHLVREGFVNPENRELMSLHASPEELLDALP